MTFDTPREHWTVQNASVKWRRTEKTKRKEEGGDVTFIALLSARKNDVMLPLLYAIVRFRASSRLFVFCLTETM